jgi:hypothetical protein
MFPDQGAVERSGCVRACLGAPLRLGSWQEKSAWTSGQKVWCDR